MKQQFYEVIRFADQERRFFQDKVRAWDYMIDFIKDIGYEADEIKWLRGSVAVVGVDIVGMEKVVGIITQDLVDG